MPRRQTVPRRWLIISDAADGAALAAARRLPRGSGVLLLQRLSARDMRRLRRIARQRNLTIESEGQRAAARVHDARELRRAMLRRVPLILLSPLFPTASHPAWKPIRRMRAASLARLGSRKLLALGGMNERRYAKIAPLGFVGWAGISAFKI